MIERRRRVRRALSGGVVLGTAAAFTLGLVEICRVALAMGGSWSSLSGLITFTLYTAAVVLLGGSLFGIALGTITAFIGFAAERLGRRKSMQRMWTARLYAVVLTPGIALVAALAFQGRHARTFAHKDALAVAIGVLGIAGVYLAARIVLWLKDRLGHALVTPVAALFLSAGLLALAITFYTADLEILPRLYFFFHVTLALLALGTAALGLGAAYLALRHHPRIRRLADPQVAAMTLIASIAAGLAGLVGFCRAEEARAVAHAQAPLVSKLLRTAAALNFGPAGWRPSPGRGVGAPEDLEMQTIDLPDGPTVPDADIFMISVDAVRADHMGVYGYTRATTPAIEREAARGVVFERAYAQVPHTSFSIATLLSGRYLYSLAALGDTARHQTIADVLRSAGYKTAGFFPPSVFYVDQKKFVGYEKSSFGFEYIKYEYLDAEKRVDQVLTYLDTVQPTRAFVWVHFFEPHEPYEAHPGFTFGPKAVDLYDAEIAYTDHAIGRLLDEIHRRRPHAIVALTADHGEEFGEHGGRYHGTSLYDEQIRVPLIITGPELAPRRIVKPVGIIDLSETLLGLLGRDGHLGGRGIDLGPWLGVPGADPKLLPPVYAELETRKMIVRETRKLICDIGYGTCELYDLQADPGERRNLIQTEAETASHLKRGLERWIGSHSLAPRRGLFADRPSRERVLERARLGDRSAVTELAPLLRDGQDSVRLAAAQLISRFPADEHNREALAAVLDDPAAGPWAAVALGALCDSRALSRLRLQPDDDIERIARMGLALAACKQRGAGAVLVRALPVEDIPLRRAVILAMGRLRDPTLVPVLVRQLDGVLERQEVVQALGRIGAKEAIPPLTERLMTDPYLTVRQEAARSLGAIGGPEGVAALRSALAKGQEAPVEASMIAALWRCGALTGALAGGQGEVVLERGELWAGRIPGEAGTLEVARPSPQVAHTAGSSPDARDAVRFTLPPGRYSVEIRGPVAFLYAR